MSFGRCLFFVVGLACVLETCVAAFDPQSYSKNTAHCKATRRGARDETVDIQLKYVDVNPNAPTTILMVHGWPGLWSTWAKQIQQFEKDYHLIALDQRGFGESTHPGEPQTSTSTPDSVADLICVLEDAKVSSAICMGHDWGSSLCYEAARLRPDIITAIIGLVVPYIPAAGPFVPIENFLPVLPALSYQLFFDHKTDAAVAQLDKDIRRTLRGIYRTVASPPPATFLKSQDTFMGAWDDIEEIDTIPFFTREEEDYMVEQFSIQGFKNTMGFYSTKNRHLGWEHAHSQGNFTILQPTLAVYPNEDPVANWLVVEKLLKSKDYVINLKTKVIPGAHWVHLENEVDTNRIIRDWLREQGFQEAHSSQVHLGDEL